MTITGRWRIVEMPGFEANYIDLVGRAFIDFETGEFAFGALQATFTPGAVANDAKLE